MTHSSTTAAVVVSDFTLSISRRRMALAHAVRVTGVDHALQYDTDNLEFSFATISSQVFLIGYGRASYISNGRHCVGGNQLCLLDLKVVEMNSMLGRYRVVSVRFRVPL